MNPVSLNLDTQQRSMVEQAAEWRLLGLLFECPTRNWREQVTALSAEISDQRLRAAAESARSEASEALYHSIFGPGGPAPAREVSYRESVQLGYLISELDAFYQAFSYQPVTPEVLDHVSVEAGFIGYLKLKEAYALACSDTERRVTASEAAQRFLEEHLAVIAEPLAATLQALGVRYLALAGEELLRRTGPLSKRKTRQEYPFLPTWEESPFDCGSQ